MKNPKNTIILFLLVILCLTLSACSAKEPDANVGVNQPEPVESPKAEDIPTANNILPARETVQDVLINRARYSAGEINLGTNETEKMAILDVLYAADLSSFVDAELTGVMGAPVPLKLRTADEEIYVEALWDAQNDAQYLIVRSAAQELVQKGPTDAFDFQTLDRLMGEVMRNEDDPVYSGKITVVATDFTAKVNKEGCAHAKFTLDSEIALDEADGGGEDVSYDVSFEVGETVYGINSEAGYFFRQDAGGKVYAKLDPQELMEVKVRLGVPNAAS